MLVFVSRKLVTSDIHKTDRLATAVTTVTVDMVYKVWKDVKDYVDILQLKIIFTRSGMV